MHDSFQTVDHKGFTIHLVPDHNAENPRCDYDHVGIFMMSHRRYDMGDKNPPYSISDFESWEDMQETLEKEFAIVIPVSMTDHSGCSLHIGKLRDFDTGMVGFAVMSQESIDKEFNGSLELGNKCLLSEIEEYEAFVSGDACGFVIEDENGDVIDSCYGFYGSEDALSQAKEAADYIAKERDSKQNQLRSAIEFMLGSQD